MKNRLILAAAIVALNAGLACAEERARLDWSQWDLLPVLHDGRVMPLDTFAREFVGKISGRENPRFDLRKSLSKEEYCSPDLADAKTLFPGEKARKFRASELLLSWLLEPEKWEYVPFLQAKHEELRKLLELPIKNDEGDLLAYVSPAQLRHSDAFMARIGELIEREKQSRASGADLRLSELDQKVRELGQALSRWQSLVLDPKPRLSANQRFVQALMTLRDAWDRSAEDLGVFAAAGAAKAGLQQPYQSAQQSFETISKLVQSPDVSAADLDEPLRQFASAAAALADQMSGLKAQMAAHPPADGDREKVARLLDEFAARTDQLAVAAKRAEVALYETDDTLRVVPALNAEALNKDRDPNDEAQPWLDLETLIYGPPGALRDYPQPQVAEVRRAFAKLADIYPQRDARPTDFAASLAGLSNSLRQLGEAIEPLRDHLPIHGRDEDLITYTRYPAPGATAIEVRYNRLQPFQWSWIVNLLATCVFVVYMIGIRRKIVFRAGLAILLVGLVWAAYGFSMRVRVTGWAPVTNMYETVIYVPFFVALLGAWFALLPVLWDGIKAAWQITAVPGTWEAAAGRATPGAKRPWSMLSLALLVPRVALAGLVLWILAIAPYSAGGRTIINLLPNVDVGQRFPDFNDLMTWAVGLVVLLPAVWYLPRVVLTAALSLFTVPLNVRGRREDLFAQAYARWPFCLAATFIAFFGAAVASYAPVLDPSFSPLQPVLRDNFWLLIHVLTIVSSYGAGALAWGLANLALGYYLFGKYRPSESHSMLAGHRPARALFAAAGFVSRRAPEETVVLSGYVYKAMQVAVVLLAAGTMLGALWADVAWGRFWGWDPKEVWALISLLVYLAILHGRYAGMFGNFGLCFGAVLGFSAIVMSWYGVNFVLGVGLHSYGFGQGGQFEVFGAVALNWLFLGAATVRYLRQTTGTILFWKRGGETDFESPDRGDESTGAGFEPIARPLAR